MNKENLKYIQLNKTIKTNCFITNISEEHPFHELFDIYASSNKSEIDFQLFAEKNNAYDALIFSMVHNTKLYIENQEINLTKLKNKIQEFCFLHQYAITDGQKSHAQASLAYCIALRIPSEYSSIEEAIDSFCRELSTNDCQSIFQLVKTELEKRQLFLRNVSSITSPITQRNTAYGPELVKFILTDEPGIHILSGRMGRGKTELLIKPSFNQLSEQERYPILCTAKRILAKNLVDDERHYQSNSFGSSSTNDQINAHKSGTCLVINSLPQPKFHQIRSSSNWLLLEELEDVLAQATGDAVGDGTLKAKEMVIDSLLKQIMQSKHIIVADAFISEHSLQLLKKLTNLPVYLYPGAVTEDSPYPTVNLYPNEAQFIANIVNDLKAGKRVLFFTDCARQGDKSKFQQLCEYLDQFSCHTLVLDADSIQEVGRVDFSDSEYQLVLISPVITSGISITEDLFDKVYVLGKQTIHPNQLLQILFRYRRAESIELHLSTNYFAKPSTLSPLQILIDELSSTPLPEITDEEFERLKQSPAVKVLIERKQIEQQLRYQYFNNFLGLLEIHQFPLQRIVVDASLTAQGKQHLQAMEKPSKSPWRPRTVPEYIALLDHENTEQLCLGDELLHTFLVTLLNKLNIDHATLEGVCSGANFTSVMHWINTGKIDSKRKGLARPIQLILQKAGLKVDACSRKKKSMINKVLKHYFAIKAEEDARESDLKTGRLWLYRIAPLSSQK